MRRSQHRKRQALATALALAALLPLISGCGADDEATPDGNGNLTATSRATLSTPADSPPPAPDPTDGRLTAGDGAIITDHGDRRDRIAAVRALVRLQRDFQAGRMADACTRINEFMLNQFQPAGSQSTDPCPVKLEAYAAQRARRGQQPLRLRLLWVRSYGVMAGIWVDEPNGDRLRIEMPLSPNGHWQYELGPMRRPDVLAAKLIGAHAYATALTRE